MRCPITVLLSAVLAIGVANAAPPEPVIRSVKLDRASLNLAAGEIVTVTVDFAGAGKASVLAVDRDGYLVRALAKAQPVSGGPIAFGWDGRDDAGDLVADEAYSFKIDWQGPAGAETYFPANAPQPLAAIDARSYDRRTATLSYALPRPSRVHIQAGTAAADRKTKQVAGAVMKTIVNREPRAGGAIAEHWTGFDESGAIFLPDLQDFVVAIAATPLPQNSVITFGNRKRRFVDTLTARRGTSLFTFNTQHEHHRGLQTQDDLSPSLKLEPLNAVWSAADRRWIANGPSTLRLRLSVEGPTAASFRHHPATVEIFLDGQRIAEPSRKAGDIVALPLAGRHGDHRVTVNWNSQWGPVAANTIELRVADQTTAAGGSR